MDGKIRVVLASDFASVGHGSNTGSISVVKLGRMSVRSAAAATRLHWEPTFTIPAAPTQASTLYPYATLATKEQMSLA